MKHLLLSFFILITPANSADFYVSPKGENTGPGTLTEPFATLERARDAVRELKSQTDKNIVVQIRGGEYRLGKTTVFGLKDSGKNSTITYEAFPGEKPVFSSSLDLTGWKKLDSPPPFLPKAAHGKIWVAKLPKGSPERFYTLYDSQGLLPRARSKGFIPADSKAASRTQFPYPEGMMRAWPNLDDVELVVRPHHAWIVNILPLQSIDTQKRIATTSVAATYAMKHLHFLPRTKSAWIENVIDALDEPGEWVLNSREGKVYLWPREDGPPEDIHIPRLKEYFLIEGQNDLKGPTDKPVRNLHFKGLTFTQGEADRIKPDDRGLQHDWQFHDKANALVRFRGAENCSIESCHFLHSGGTAIRADLHSQKNRFVSNHLEHLGGTGILVAGYGPGTKDVSHHNLIENNHIHHVGRIHAHSPGIFLWQCGENRVAHNLIHHTPYSGIIVSGVMTQFFSKKGNSRELVRTIRRHETGPTKNATLEQIRPFLHSHDNRIEYNEIHHVMQELNDGNGIYIRGCGAGNIIRRNYLHDLLAPTVMQSSIRTDGGQRDTLITENLIYRCTAQGMQVKLNNRAINNIIADIRPGTHKGEERTPMFLKLYEGPLTGGAYQKNIFYHPGKEVVFYQETKNFRTPVGAFAKDADTDHNIYFCAGDPEVGKAFLAQKQSEGIDKHSLAQDPLFVDPANGDFSFQPNSPALKLGITPLDLSKVGLKKENE
ncbi:right-handed parallel beta-helix repeat-containing protein [Akkermansiaceae bacterium]|nr:right-handed parallel beta-helix repeat-containing protein [Akkermansiaceae bacterium]MDA7930341.1 right-handed parallel beta-helix repeat-containing protein [Akkermansiaceae bacterium]MDB4423746.1 right-handed parallel beta-helix repeat-containing protein [bacterium]MDB4466144.1 right-handed parallel beta-helix repeat-containing protein [bacterium]